jgi:hypothetical protein
MRPERSPEKKFSAVPQRVSEVVRNFVPPMLSCGARMRKERKKRKKRNKSARESQCLHESVLALFLRQHIARILFSVGHRLLQSQKQKKMRFSVRAVHSASNDAKRGVSTDPKRALSSDVRRGDAKTGGVSNTGIRGASNDEVCSVSDTESAKRICSSLSESVGESFLLRQCGDLMKNLFSGAIERQYALIILDHIRKWNGVDASVDSFATAQEAMKTLFEMDPSFTGRKTFLYCEGRLAETMELTDAQIRHLKARRLREGDDLVLCFGNGAFAAAKLRDQRRGIVRVVSSGFCAPPPFKLRVCAAIPKGDRDDQMISSLAELGVEEFVALSLKRQSPGSL